MRKRDKGYADVQIVVRPEFLKRGSAPRNPKIAEKLFIVLKAEVQFTPVMNQEELGRGLEASAESQHVAV